MLLVGESSGIKPANVVENAPSSKLRGSAFLVRPVGRPNLVEFALPRSDAEDILLRQALPTSIHVSSEAARPRTLGSW